MVLLDDTLISGSVASLGIEVSELCLHSRPLVELLFAIHPQLAVFAHSRIFCDNIIFETFGAPFLRKLNNDALPIGLFLIVCTIAVFVGPPHMRAVASSHRVSRFADPDGSGRPMNLGVNTAVSRHARNVAFTFDEDQIKLNISVDHQVDTVSMNAGFPQLQNPPTLVPMKICIA